MSGFKLSDHSRSDKDVVIETPDEDLRIYVDYDDVNHPRTDLWIAWMVDALNRGLSAMPPRIPTWRKEQ